MFLRVFGVGALGSLRACLAKESGGSRSQILILETRDRSFSHNLNSVLGCAPAACRRRRPIFRGSRQSSEQAPELDHGLRGVEVVGRRRVADRRRCRPVVAAVDHRAVLVGGCTPRVQLKHHFGDARATGTRVVAAGPAAMPLRVSISRRVANGSVVSRSINRRGRCRGRRPRCPADRTSGSVPGPRGRSCAGTGSAFSAIERLCPRRPLHFNRAWG